MGFPESEVSAPGRNRTCDLGIRRPLLYPTELRRQRAGQSSQRGHPLRRAARAYQMPSGASDWLLCDPRHSQAAGRCAVLRATMPEPECEGAFAMSMATNVTGRCSAGRCPGIAPGRRSGRDVPRGIAPAERLPVAGDLGRRLGFHRVPAARPGRARPHGGERAPPSTASPAVWPPSAPTRCCAMPSSSRSARITPSRCTIRSTTPAHAGTASRASGTPPSTAAATPPRPPTSPTVRVVVTICSTSGGSPR